MNRNAICQLLSTSLSCIHILYVSCISSLPVYYDEHAWNNRFASIMKPPLFYAHHGDIQSRTLPKPSSSSSSSLSLPTMTPAYQIIASQPSQRCYFYNIDLHGRLYLEENPIKNITSSIKDIKFLDFFFAHIKYINETHKEYMKQHDIPIQDYPYVSICQKEWNFIRPAATPIVFHSLIDNEQYLLYGSSNTLILREPFDETNGLVISKISGKLYHKLTTHSYYPLSIRKQYPSIQTQQLQYALIRSTIALSLSDRIVDLEEFYRNNNNDDETSSIPTNSLLYDDGNNYRDRPKDNKRNRPKDTNARQDTNELEPRPLLPQAPSTASSSGLGFITKYNRVVPIMYLPSYAEPGPYAMSSIEQK